MWKPDWGRRDRTNIYIVPAAKYDEQEFLGYRIWPSAAIVDWRTDFLSGVRPKQLHLGLTVSGEMDRIRRVGNSDRQVFVIINTEYFLAHFTPIERDRFWSSLWSDFPHLKGIVIFTTLDTAALLPNKVELERWANAGRLIQG